LVLSAELIFVTPVASGTAGRANVELCPASSCGFVAQLGVQQIERLQQLRNIYLDVLKVTDINKSATNPQQIVMEFERLSEFRKHQLLQIDPRIVLCTAMNAHYD